MDDGVESHHVRGRSGTSARGILGPEGQKRQNRRARQTSRSVHFSPDDTFATRYDCTTLGIGTKTEVDLEVGEGMVPSHKQDIVACSTSSQSNHGAREHIGRRTRRSSLTVSRLGYPSKSSRTISIPVQETR